MDKEQFTAIAYAGKEQRKIVRFYMASSVSEACALACRDLGVNNVTNVRRSTLEEIRETEQ